MAGKIGVGDTAGATIGEATDVASGASEVDFAVSGAKEAFGVVKDAAELNDISSVVYSADTPPEGSDMGRTQVVIVIDSVLYYDAVGADYIDRVR
jgi:hypothetical protein